MAKNALFTGLIFDENDAPVACTRIGDESFYVVDDCGFRRHIPSEGIDREVMKIFTSQISGNEEYLANQAAQMSGQSNLMSMAIFRNAFKNIDKQIDMMLEQGIPEDARAAVGMMGFKITINIHGEIANVNLPQAGGE